MDFPMSSLWLDQARGSEPACPALQGATRADVCIVGGGYTGLWTALQLREQSPGLDIVLLEAQECGAGASGRNGGFMLSWAAKFETLLKVCGTDEALRLLGESERIAADVAGYLKRHGVDAQLRQDGWLWTASNAAQVDSWMPCIELLARHGQQAFVALPADEVRRLSGSAAHLAGVLSRSSATVHPGMYVRGLRRIALAKGIRIYEHTPMRSLRARPQPKVATARGEVRAAKVVLAMNAWSTRFRELNKGVVVVGSDLVATAPHPEALEKIGLTNGVAISDSRLFTNYYRNTCAGEMVFGRGGGDFAFNGAVGRLYEGPSRFAREVAAILHRFYPALAPLGIVRSWSGPIDRSMDGLPCFGHLGGHPDIVYGYGYSGNGVGPTYLGGKFLASMVLENDDAWRHSALARGLRGRFPPEPFRYVGSRVVKAALVRKEAAEDQGQAPARLDTMLAGLAPGGLVPVARKEKA
ncbi:putative aminophosphonate oxidoreductase [Bordetella bronchiseptica M435/02/3]|nr:putative aminophosphonate oxidoreductase [Bordetella bronchiseptica M435/02/3]